MIKSTQLLVLPSTFACTRAFSPERSDEVAHSSIINRSLSLPKHLPRSTPWSACHTHLTLKIHVQTEGRLFHIYHILDRSSMRWKLVSGARSFLQKRIATRLVGWGRLLANRHHYFHMGYVSSTQIDTHVRVQLQFWFVSSCFAQNRLFFHEFIPSL